MASVTVKIKNDPFVDMLLNSGKKAPGRNRANDPHDDAGVVESRVHDALDDMLLDELEEMQEDADVACLRNSFRINRGSATRYSE